ncbi:phospho-N-acetylmuramoyl-pentapeptide-transferase [Allobaculum sp. JKK-2023]|uniref:phospho-N-acetylmuramoyl-pentapeptide- transferase n=1 Tax=Allobaculum sp. JKK-2023 TaxID=3108943 RepID=UPI002B055208|nr:phospho-N-acetylmuramoyl-pentapeptide-transferase [Allobaculum sp. JKK-2023]
MSTLATLTVSDAFLILSMGLLVLAFMLAGMPRLIRYLHKLKFGQTEREEGLASHKKKTGTPTMGGLAFILAPLMIYLALGWLLPGAWNKTAWVLLIAYVGYGLIGFIDDYLIVVQHSNIGLKPSLKFGAQAVLAVVLTFVYLNGDAPTILLPGHVVWNVPVWLFVLLCFFLFTGASNAVNLSDGVDGLCAGLSIIALVPFVFAMFWQGQVSGAAILILVIFGLIGYLKFNLHPAKVFMGDTGSLALGGLLAAAAMMTHLELLLIVAGIVFIAETLSDIIQVTYYKKTHKRIFLMAPLHHHYEKKGWSEMKVCAIFWTWQAVFAGISMALAWFSI